ncbi:MAG: hypothetical protein ABEJ59_00220 [Halanaeroarchaeum sp.]
MRTRTLGPLALLEFLFPRRLVAAAERLAFRNPEAATLRSSTIALARIEGVAFLWALLREQGVNRPVRALLGAIGLPALLVPDRLLSAALWLAYRDSGRIELRSWVRPVTRLVGVAYLLVAAGLLPRRREE